MTIKANEKERLRTLKTKTDTQKYLVSLYLDVNVNVFLDWLRTIRYTLCTAKSVMKCTRFISSTHLAYDECMMCDVMAF